MVYSSSAAPQEMSERRTSGEEPMLLVGQSIFGPSIQYARPREHAEEELAQAAHDRNARFRSLRKHNPHIGGYQPPRPRAAATPKPEGNREEEEGEVAVAVVATSAPLVLLGPCLQCTAAGSSRCSLLTTQSLDRTSAPCSRCARVGEPHCLQATRNLSKPYGPYRQRYRWAAVSERPADTDMRLCDQDLQLVFPRDPDLGLGADDVRDIAEDLLCGPDSYVARTGILLSEDEKSWLALPAWHANDNWENRIDPDFEPARWNALLRRTALPDRARLAALGGDRELVLEERKLKRLAAKRNPVVKPEGLSTVEEEAEAEEEVMLTLLPEESSVEEDVATPRAPPVEGSVEKGEVPRMVLNGEILNGKETISVG